jgi:hypothetical protein
MECPGLRSGLAQHAWKVFNHGVPEDLNEAVMDGLDACEDLFTSPMELGDEQPPELVHPPLGSLAHDHEPPVPDAGHEALVR